MATSIDGVFFVSIAGTTDYPGSSFGSYAASTSKFQYPNEDTLISISGIKETFDARATEITIELNALNNDTLINELFFEPGGEREGRQIFVSRKIDAGSLELIWKGTITKTSISRSGQTSVISISASNDIAYAENNITTVRASDFGYSSSPDIVYWGYLEVSE